jgi:hypothetical protein
LATRISVYWGHIIATFLLLGKVDGIVGISTTRVSTLVVSTLVINITIHDAASVILATPPNAEQ